MLLIDFICASDFNCYDLVQLQDKESERLCFFGAFRDIPYCLLMRRISMFIDSCDDTDHPVLVISDCEV